MKKEAQIESDPAMAWMCHLKAMCGKQSCDLSTGEADKHLLNSKRGHWPQAKETFSPNTSSVNQ